MTAPLAFSISISGANDDESPSSYHDIINSAPAQVRVLSGTLTPAAKEFIEDIRRFVGASSSFSDMKVDVDMAVHIKRIQPVQGPNDRAGQP